MDSPRVIPAILTDEPEALVAMARQAAGFTDYVQVDVMDGDFVPSKSLTKEEMDHVALDVAWEAHLMVRKPSDYLETLRRCGARKVIFHFESAEAPGDVIESARWMGLEVGLAVNPETDLAKFQPLATSVDSVLFLSVHPGYYGAAFLPDVLEKVKTFREMSPGIPVGIDGGIKQDNIAWVSSYGINEICVGSAVFLASDPADSFRRLQELASSS